MRERFPAHPALDHVLVDPVDLASRMGFSPPADVRLGGCPAILSSDEADEKNIQFSRWLPIR